MIQDYDCEEKLHADHYQGLVRAHVRLCNVGREHQFVRILVTTWVEVEITTVKLTGSFDFFNDCIHVHFTYFCLSQAGKRTVLLDKLESPLRMSVV